MLLELLELAERDTSFIVCLVDIFVDRARVLAADCRRGEPARQLVGMTPNIIID